MMTDRQLAEEVAELVEQLGSLLAGAGTRIAIAESLTGGLVCSSIVANPEHGGVLERGLVVYSVDAKCELLSLDRPMVEACDGVSAEVAEAMAAALLARSEAGIALATTGYAGPREEDEEVGLVHIGVAHRSGAARQVEHHYGDVGRERVRYESTRDALRLALEVARDCTADG